VRTAWPCCSVSARSVSSVWASPSRRSASAAAAAVGGLGGLALHLQGQQRDGGVEERAAAGVVEGDDEAPLADDGQRGATGDEVRGRHDADGRVGLAVPEGFVEVRAGPTCGSPR
jgi:hypothetical protein